MGAAGAMMLYSSLCPDGTRDEMMMHVSQSGVTVRDDMGTFRTEMELAHPARPEQRQSLRDVLVDTGAELSWVPAAVLESLGVTRRKLWHFRQADGSVLARSTGYAMVYAGGTETIDEVVFGEPGDLTLLGAHTLEGLNLRVEPAAKRLVDAGPAPAALSLFQPVT
jgi:predicted aspartyl protease